MNHKKLLKAEGGCWVFVIFVAFFLLACRSQHSTAPQSAPTPGSLENAQAYLRTGHFVLAISDFHQAGQNPIGGLAIFCGFLALTALLAYRIWVTLLGREKLKENV